MSGESSPQHATSRFWRSRDGLRLHARDHAAAAGPARLPVICLHGLTRNSRDFETLAPWIAARHRRVLALDIRGRGLSDRDPAADYRMPAYADDVAQLLRALGIAEALFVGTSMGGLITMELAGAHPSLIAGAAINDVGPVLGAAGLERIARYVGKTAPLTDWPAAAAYLASHNATALPHYTADDWLGMARRLFREADGRIVADYDPAIAEAFADAPLPGDPWDRWHALADGTRAVLLIRGALSDLLERDTATRMAHAARVTLREVPAVGHAPMLDEPAALEALETFLTESR